jgi:CHAT domain-containing protein
MNRVRTAVRLSIAVLTLCSPVTAAPEGDPLGAIRAQNKAGRYADAESAGRALLTAVEAQKGPDSLETADVLDVLVESLHKGGKTGQQETIDLGERALKIREARSGPEDLTVVPSVLNLAEIAMVRGEYARSKFLFERAVAIRENLLGPEHFDSAKSLLGVARVSFKMGDYATGRQIGQRVTAILEKALGPDHPDVSVALNLLANILVQDADYGAAREVATRAAGIVERSFGPEHPQVAGILGNLIRVNWLAGDYPAARSYAERSLAIREKVLGPDHPLVANSLTQLALVMVDMGDAETARPLFERALAVREKALGPDHAEVAEALANLSVTLTLQGHYAAARPLQERAIAILERALGPDHPKLGAALEGLGDLLLASGDRLAATLIHERALAFRERTFGPEHHDVATSLHALAALARAEGAHERAQALYERALAIREKVLGPDHMEVAETLAGLAKVELTVGRRAAALEAALRAERIARERFRQVARGVAEREALRYESIRASGLDVALTVLASDAPSVKGGGAARVWDELVRSRAMVLDEIASRHRTVVSAGGPAIAPLAAALDASRARLAHLAVAGPDPDRPEAYRERLRVAQDEKDRAERALAEASIVFRDEQTRLALGMADAAAALPPESALVAYVEYTRLAAAPEPLPSYMALVLPAPGAEPRVVPLGPAREIDAAVERWRSEAGAAPKGLALAGGRAEARYRKAGERLRRLIWDPVAARLEGGRLVFVVPDGALSLVSLASLPGAGDRYLMETGPTFHYLSAERDIVRRGERDAMGHGLLVLGGPDYEGKPDTSAIRVASAGGDPGGGALDGNLYRGPRSGCGDFRALRFGPLPGARVEAEEIASLWNSHRGDSGDRIDTLLLTGAGAGEAEFKRAASGRRVVHLATHGFFMQGRCGSALQSARQAVSLLPGAGVEGPTPPGDNPLLLSGLALAGANRREESGPEQEDGILTAEEIGALDLSGVEWAVLSGCETGVGRVQAGEGVLGLRRAFQMAGAGALIMSLWPVEDDAAREWMRALYAGRLGGMTTAEAVRSAGRALIESRRRAARSTHPFSWAAFVAAGDWR